MATSVLNDDSDRPGRYRLGVGSVLTDGERVVRLVGCERRADGTLDLLLDDSGDTERVAFQDLCERSSALAPTISGTTTPVPEPSGPEWRSLPDDVRAHAMTWAADLLQIIDGSPDGNLERARALRRVDPRYDPRTTTLAQRIDEKVIELSAQGFRASRPSLYRKIAKFKSRGVAGLVDERWQQRRDVITGTDPAIVDVVSDVLRGKSSSASKQPRRQLLVACRIELLKHDLGADLNVHRLGRLVGELSRDLGLHRAWRSRQTHTNKPTGPHGRMAATRPGEIVQIDATPANVHCWSPEAGWMPATILTAIDVYTRCILALRVVPGASSTRDASLLLWDACRPVVTRAGWPYQLRRWHGVPRLVRIDLDATRARNEPRQTESIGEKPAVTPSMVVVDHGAEFDALAFRSACVRNGIDIMFSRPRTPTDKAIVESWHVALDHALTNLPGYKGANPQNHPRDAERDAALTCADLHDMLWTWIVTVYHRTPHSGLREPNNRCIKVSPAAMFDRFIEHGGTIDVAYDPYRLLSFLSCEDRTVGNNGISLGGRLYDSRELDGIRSTTAAGVGAKTRKISIYYDRWDLARVYLQHPVTHEWICVPRAHSLGKAAAPFSDAVTRAAINEQIEGRRRPLTADEIHNLEAKVQAQWAAGHHTDRRAAQLAAIENARQTALAHDIQSWDGPLRDLAFGAALADGKAGDDEWPDDEDAIAARVEADADLFGPDDEDDGLAL